MKSHIEFLVEKGERLDGRKFDEFRKPIKLELGISNKAEGSAMVIIGNTKVMAGVKLGVGEPFPDSQNEGVLITSAELLPMANPEFFSGPPGQVAIELARIIDRGIRESKMVDFKKLCIREGELVWTVFLDIYPINDDGNLIDAGMIAAVAAINSAVFPKLNGDKIVYGEFTKKKLPVTKNPITVTVNKIGNSLILDPSNEEEGVINARLSVSVSENDEIYALQKSGITGFNVDEVEKIIDIAIKKSKELRKVLK